MIYLGDEFVNKNKLATFRFLMTTIILFLILLALIIYLIISNSDSKVLINSVKSIDYKDNTFYVLNFIGRRERLTAELV